MNGYEIWYDKLKGGLFCKIQNKSSCLYLQGDACLICPSQLYPYESDCIVDDFQSKSLVVNEFTYFTQTKPSIAGFSDGSVMAIWNGNYEDGFNWGVQGQVLDSQREKIGINFQVNQITQGNQHSAQISILNDDTAIILYIDGNPEEGAILKVARFTKNQQRIGDDIDIDVIRYYRFDITNDNVAKVIKLKNGGYVIGYLTLVGEPLQKALKLKFYNSGNQQISNLIKTIEQFSSIDDIFLISSTDQNVAIIHAFQVHIYSLDGSLLISKDFMLQFFLNQAYLSSISQYFVLVFYTYDNNNISAYAQFYDQNFVPSGDKILIKSIPQQVDGKYMQISYIQVDQYKGGLSVIIEFVKNGQSSTQEQYYLNSNMEIQYMNQYKIKNNWSVLTRMKIAESVDQSFFVIWAKVNIFDFYDNSNIWIQKMTGTGEHSTQLIIQCNKGCTKCITQYECTQCVGDYLLIDQYCHPVCQQNCKSCIMPSVCIQCKDGYYEEIQGLCSLLKPSYHQPQPLIPQEIQGETKALVSSSDGTSCFFTLYRSQDSENYQWNAYFIFESQLTKKLTIQKQINYFTNLEVQKIEQDYVGVSYFYDQIEVFRIGQNQQVIIHKVIYLQLIDSDSSTYKDWAVLVALINNQYSLTYIQNAYDKGSQGKIYKITLDSELVPIGQPQVIFQQENLSSKERIDSTTYSFYSINGIILWTGEQLIQRNCPYSQILNSYSCNIFDLQNGNLIQIFTQFFFEPNAFVKGGQLSYYRLLNKEYTPITLEMKINENKLQQQEFIKFLSFSNTFAIVLKEYPSYNSFKFQLVIQYFENSGTKLGSQIYIGLFQSDTFIKFIQLEKSCQIFWQERKCLDEICLTQQNMILFKEYDEQGNEITNSQNIKCMQQCDECINESFCTKCSTNYNLDANSQCVLQCPTNCNKCSVVSQCEICQTGYELLQIIFL